MKEKPQSSQWNKLLSARIKPLNKRVRSIEKKTIRHAHTYVVQKADRFRSVRRHVIGWLVLVCILMFAAIAQMVFYGRNVADVQSQPGNVYAEGVVDKVNTLHPLYVSTPTAKALQKLIFSGLTSYDQNGRLQNDLAESIVVSEKGKKYTVTLRPHIMWHDGAQLTAEDVVYTVKAMQNPQINSRDYKTWKNITVTSQSSQEVTFTLPSAFGPFNSLLTFSVLPKHILKDIPVENIPESEFSKKPIGSGPFKAVGIQAVDITTGKNAVKLEASDTYWSGRPSLDRFLVYTYSQSKDLLNGLRAHEVSAAVDIPRSQLSQLQKAGYQIHNIPLDSGMFAFLKTDSPILKDVAVRQALVSLTNRQPIVDSQQGKKLEGPIVGQDLPKTSQVSQLPYDTAKALSLFEQAGWKKNAKNLLEKDGVILSLDVIAPNTYEYTSISQELARQWRKVGITVKQQFVDPQQIQQNILKPRAYDVVLYELEIGGDPDVMAYWHSSQRAGNGLNLSNFSSGISDDALLTARLREDSISRDAKYATFAKDWAAQAPAIALYQPTLSYTTFTEVDSLYSTTIVPSIADRFATASRWTISKGMVYKTP